MSEAPSNPQSADQKIIFLFGAVGAGKTHLGEKLAPLLGGHFFDGDNCLTDQDRDHLKSGAFTEEMRDTLHDRIIKEVRVLLTQHKIIVVATTLFRHRHRELLLTTFREVNPLFVHVTADESVLQERVTRREHFLPAGAALTSISNMDPVPEDFLHAVFYNQDGADEYGLAALIVHGNAVTNNTSKRS